MIVRYYRAAFVLGVAAVVLGVAAGLYWSLAREHRLPPLVFQNMAEIEELLDRHEYDEAIERLTVSLDLVPGERSLIHNVLGNALAAEGRHEEAIEHYRLALELDPSFAEAHGNLGVALARTGSLGEGLAELVRAVELGPQDEGAWSNLGRALHTAESRGLESVDPSSAPIVARARELLEQSGRRSAGAPSAANAAADPMETPAGQSARHFAQLFLAGDVETLHASFDSELQQRMPVDRLRALRGQVDRELGVEVERLRERIEPRAGASAYSRVSRFDQYDGLVELALVIAPDGTISSFGLRTGTLSKPEKR